MVSVPSNARSNLGPRLRLNLEPGNAFGPGKAALLAGIRDTGSIAASGRRMGMSYKRAWTLTDALNHQFRAPLVTAAKGGAQGGGAQLTELGVEVLGRYQRMETRAAKSIATDFAALRALVISKRQ